MKKRFALVAVVFSIMVTALACSQRDCKAKGCSEDVFQKGFCEEHYLENAIEEGLKDLGELFK